MTLQDQLTALQAKLAASSQYPAGYAKRILAIQSAIDRVKVEIAASE